MKDIDPWQAAAYLENIFTGYHEKRRGSLTEKDCSARALQYDIVILRKCSWGAMTVSLGLGCMKNDVNVLMSRLL